jgi:imidazole glycerol-phosphate synthase subunit HisF
VLRPRIIPALLVQNGGLVKTVGFDAPKYVGDPINAVRIFNEKQVDELIVADIDATPQGREPDYGLIRNLAAECRMPLCYAGGVTRPEQIERIIGLGVEKVAVGSAAVRNPAMIEESVRRVGGQSVVAVLDVRKAGILRRYEVFTNRGGQPAGLHPVEYARRVEALGAGEVLLNSIDRDGTMKGYDLDLVAQVRSAVRLPMSVLGGAGTLADVQGLMGRFGIIGAAAGSLFVFKGKYRAVLINYPALDEKDAIIRAASAAGLPDSMGVDR